MNFISRHLRIPAKRFFNILKKTMSTIKLRKAKIQANKRICTQINQILDKKNSPKKYKHMKKIRNVKKQIILRNTTITNLIKLIIFMISNKINSFNREKSVRKHSISNNNLQIKNQILYSKTVLINNIQQQMT